MPATRSDRLSAPLSRTEDAVAVSSPCMACGAVVSGWAWINTAGVGVLMHRTFWGSEACPSAASFDWATGVELSAPVEAVAA
ncbi:hypothetical protein DSC45_27195 [Streptomyces sp. YIM 130001]|uniref:hypothetical protein n=1 Tax=Streptomyces sp. YIM 130001 TaxID=2259644 RepID=UPI000ED3D06B|nr:hypothetical protein [Streptomyces sp. YIM 130001]RII11986.1 hypothetical protein DSC45_27195 [Streptomyces sp. YIM 130001]